MKDYLLLRLRLIQGQYHNLSKVHPSGLQDRLDHTIKLTELAAKANELSHIIEECNRRELINA